MSHAVETQCTEILLDQLQFNCYLLAIKRAMTSTIDLILKCLIDRHLFHGSHKFLMIEYQGQVCGRDYDVD